MTVEIIRSGRKTMALQVYADGRIVVRAPHYVPEREIRAFVEAHGDWIQKRQEKLHEAEAASGAIKPLTDAEIRNLREAARKDLEGRLQHYASLIGVSYGRVSIRQQKTKWGSCSSKGNLNFNCLLMLAPESVRDYVVVHELCHRKQMNHSAAFWAEVARVFPDYQNARRWLKTHGQELMRYGT